MALIVPKEYGWVLASSLATGVALIYIGGRVGKLRSELNVPLPYLYADQSKAESNKDLYRFNCAQRGHQNLLETYPVVLFTLLAGGLKHPLVSAVSGLVYIVGAISFYLGYAKGDPAARYKGLGGLSRIPLFTGLATTVSTIGTLLGYF